MVFTLKVPAFLVHFCQAKYLGIHTPIATHGCWRWEILLSWDLLLFFHTWSYQRFYTIPKPKIQKLSFPTKSETGLTAIILKKRSKTHKRLKERFLIRPNRTKHARFVLFCLIKKRSFDLLCVLDLSFPTTNINLDLLIEKWKNIHCWSKSYKVCKFYFKCAFADYVSTRSLKQLLSPNRSLLFQRNPQNPFAWGVQPKVC